MPPAVRHVWSLCRVPVNTEEVDDYLNYVTKPMDLEMMHMKLDDGEYKCAQVNRFIYIFSAIFIPGWRIWIRI